MGDDEKEVFVERGQVVGFFHGDEGRFVGFNAVIVEFLLGGKHDDGIDVSGDGKGMWRWFCTVRLTLTVASNRLACRRNHIHLKTLFVVTEQTDFREAVEGKPFQFLESHELAIDPKETHVDRSLSHYGDSTWESDYWLTFRFPSSATEIPSQDE